LLNRRRHHRRVLVEHRGLASQLLAEYADDASQAGPDRRPGDTALVGERLLQRCDLLLRDPVRNRLRDRDERRGQRHLQQRELPLRAGSDDRGGDRGVSHADAEAEARHPGIGQSADVGALFGDGPGQPDPGRED